MSYDPPIILYKAVLMQRIADAVRYGYRWHVSGTVPLNKATAFVRKFSSLYLVDARKDARYRRKRDGFGNAILFLWQPQPDGPLPWWLLVTDGDHPAHVLEPLCDGDTVRVQCTGYELVRLTKPGHDRPVLTWRMSKQTYAGWRERIIKTVRTRSSEQLYQAWHSLYHTPGFSGIRSQVGQLVALLRAEWRRSRPEPFPLSQGKLWYIQRLKTASRPLSALLKGRSCAATPHAPAPVGGAALRAALGPGQHGAPEAPS